MFSSLRIEATSGCNLKCSYCFANDYMNDRKKTDLSRAEIKKVLDMSRNGGIKKILWSGGEPLFRDDFLGLLKDSYGIKTSFVTNATLLNENILNEIKKLEHVTRIRFSIDGFKAHDKYRIGSSWKQIIEKINLTKKIIPNISIVPQTTATYESLDEVISLVELFESLKLDRWRMFYLRFSGHISEGAIKLDSNYYVKYIETLGKLAKVVKDKKINLQIETDCGYKSDLDNFLTDETTDYDYLNLHPCNYFLHVLTIRSNGDIAICPFFDVNLGNIRDYSSLKQLENNMSLMSWRNLKTKDLKSCSKCRYFKLCLGGCRKTAIDLMGSFKEVDPVSCFTFPLLENKLWKNLSPKTQNYYNSLIVDEGTLPEWNSSKLNSLFNDFYKKSEENNI